jgi:F420-dependent oxidoreductase-like protein
MAKAPHFGVVLPQFNATWNHALDVAMAAEEAGFDSVWCVDHFVDLVGPSSVLEAWTEMTAIAARTRRVRVGHQVLSITFRSPSLLAKMAATLDVISGGRLIVGLGAGWMEAEHVQYGYPFPPIAVRLAQLGETLEILRRMWTEERATFTGRHFTVRDASCDPKPAQKRLPILVGGGGERVLLRHVARHADIWGNLGATHGDVARKREILAGHCRAIGRDPAEIEVAQQTLAAIATDRAEAARRTDAIFNVLGFLDSSRELSLTGTPDDIRARIERNRSLGVGTFIMTFGRGTDPEDVRLFGREVIAAYR